MADHRLRAGSARPPEAVPPPRPAPGTAWRGRHCHGPGLASNPRHRASRRPPPVALRGGGGSLPSVPAPPPPPRGGGGRAAPPPPPPPTNRGSLFRQVPRG